MSLCIDKARNKKQKKNQGHECLQSSVVEVCRLVVATRRHVCAGKGGGPEMNGGCYDVSSTCRYISRGLRVSSCRA